MPIVEVNHDHIVLKSGEKIPTHTLIWTAGVKANSDAEKFDMPAARANRLLSNEYMQAKGFEDKGIYVVGDLVYFEESDKENRQHHKSFKLLNKQVCVQQKYFSYYQRH